MPLRTERPPRYFPSCCSLPVPASRHGCCTCSCAASTWATIRRAEKNAGLRMRRAPSAGAGDFRGFLGQQTDYALPVGAAYCLLVMTNMIYNNFGGDGGGIQFFLFSPVSFRQIMVAKNLAHM